MANERLGDTPSGQPAEGELVTILGRDFEGELNDSFTMLGIGRAGLPKRLGPGIVTARDVVQAHRDFFGRGGNLSEEDALAQVLKMHSVPTVEAVKIGILWGRAYPQPADISK